MFCKWCGEDLSGNLTVCAHCGKEQPPLSDCGGFFNLTPNAKPIRQTTEQTFSQREQNLSYAPAPTRKQKKKKSKAGIFALVISLLALLAVIVSSCSINKKIGKMKTKISALKRSAVERIEPETESTKSTEETTEEATEDHGKTSNQGKTNPTSDEAGRDG